MPWVLKPRGSEEAMEVLPEIPKGSNEKPFPRAESKGGVGVGLNNPVVKLSDCSSAPNCWTSACMVEGNFKPRAHEVHFQQQSVVTPSLTNLGKTKNTAPERLELSTL